MNLLRQVLQADPFVLRELLTELGKDAPHRLVLVVVVLELLKRTHERVPTALGDPDREHDEERVQPGLLDDDAVFHEVTCHDRSGDPCFGELARNV